MGLITALLLLLLSGAGFAQDLTCAAGTASWTYSRFPFPMGFAGTIGFSSSEPPDAFAAGLPVVYGQVTGDGTGAEQLLALAARTRVDGLVDALIVTASSANGLVPGALPSPSTNTGWLFISGASAFELPDSSALDTLSQDNALEFLQYIVAEHKIVGVFNSFSVASRSARGIGLSGGSGLGADVDNSSFLVTLSTGLTLYALPDPPQVVISLGETGLQLAWGDDVRADEWLVETSPEPGGAFVPLQAVTAPVLLLGDPAEDSRAVYRVRARRNLPF
jgi:hypothetical protein